MKTFLKFQSDFDVFSDALSAKSRSQAIGLEGKIHVYDVDGQAYYVPGASHTEYLSHMEYGSDEEVTEDRMVEALRAVVAEIMNKDEGYKLPESARNNARQVLDWKEEHGDEVKGMTSTGWRRARQLANNGTVGAETVRAMAQFNRHRKNSKIDEKHKGEPWKDAGYVAWLGWGGDTGIDWAIRQSESMEKADGPKVGDKVSWNSSGGRASGIIRQIVRDGDVPNIPVKVTGTKDEPAARIEITDDEGKPTGEMVGHKLSTVSKEMQDEGTFKVLKIDQEQRIIFGWASVTKVDGQLVVDRQGDVIKTETLHKAINDFMKGVRVGKVMHTGERVGDIIHSFPVSKDIMDALGIQTNKEGWIVGYYVEDDNTWNLVKSGEYTEFSIGGRGHKEEFSGN